MYVGTRRSLEIILWYVPFFRLLQSVLLLGPKKGFNLIGPQLSCTPGKSLAPNPIPVFNIITTSEEEKNNLASLNNLPNVTEQSRVKGKQLVWSETNQKIIITVIISCQEKGKHGVHKMG